MALTTLPSYSGEDPKCIKCGHVGARTEHRPYGQCIHPTDEAIGYEANERLHRACFNCGYAWDEAIIPGVTADQSKEY